MQSLCWRGDKGLSSHPAEGKLKNNYGEQQFLSKCSMPCIFTPELFSFCRWNRKVWELVWGYLMPVCFSNSSTVLTSHDPSGWQAWTGLEGEFSRWCRLGEVGKRLSKLVNEWNSQARKLRNSKDRFCLFGISMDWENSALREWTWAVFADLSQYWTSFSGLSYKYPSSPTAESGVQFRVNMKPVKKSGGLLSVALGTTSH